MSVRNIDRLRPPRGRMLRHQPMSRWTPALAVRRTACRIDDCKAALFDVVSIWGDVDQMVCDDADRLMVELDRMLSEIKELVRGRLANGKDVGP